MRLIGGRRLAAVAATATLVGLGIAGSATTADASTPILYASANQMAHKCTVIGIDQYGNQGVVCADLLAYQYTSGPEAIAQVEIFCQTSSGVVEQCAEAHAYGTLSNAQTGTGSRAEFDCGHAYGRCSGGRNYRIMGSQWLEFYANDNCQTSPAYNYWAVIYGQGALTSIELPRSDKWVYLDSANANDSGNQSSGHYQICL